MRDSLRTELALPIIRLQLPCATPLEFYGTYAQQLAGAFFVAHEVPGEDEVRVAVQVSLSGTDFRLKGDGSAHPTTRNGRRGVVIRLDRLEVDQTETAAGDEGDGEQDDGDDDPFSDGVTRASDLPEALAAQLRASLGLRGAQGKNIIRRDASEPDGADHVSEIEGTSASVHNWTSPHPVVEPGEKRAKPELDQAAEPASGGAESDDIFSIPDTFDPDASDDVRKRAESTSRPQAAGSGSLLAPAVLALLLAGLLAAALYYFRDSFYP